ncbi:hypothetical protein [Streptomyces griseicoloratus]|uniref:hypothetical protein n=1 Tax=Streptomyces griseicoloratus TaxID=2752516 RepID=UPI001CB6E6DC|nr:hypothetical protein [Streptomyces griseicoloratus]
MAVDEVGDAASGERREVLCEGTVSSRSPAIRVAVAGARSSRPRTESAVRAVARASRAGSQPPAA